MGLGLFFVILGAINPGIVFASVPFFVAAFMLTVMQIGYYFAPPPQSVGHFCSNCGVEVAQYTDPKREKPICCGLIPARYCRRETTVEDHFEDDGLIFQYEQAHPENTIMSKK